jgi:hypothetical protein
VKIMMKIDAYTRIVLTVIACTLVIFVFKNALDMKRAAASGGITKVAICDTEGYECATVGRSYLGGSIGIRVFTQE